MRYILHPQVVLEWITNRKKIEHNVVQKFSDLLDQGLVYCSVGSLAELEKFFRTKPESLGLWREFLKKTQFAKVPSYGDIHAMAQAENVEDYFLEQSAKAVDATVLKQLTDVQMEQSVLPIPFIDLKTQYHHMQSEMEHDMDLVLNNTQFIMGDAVQKCEQALAHYTGSRHALTCGNGTDALMLAVMAIDIKPGDEVITTVYSFFAAAEVIALFQATPVFVDIEEDTYNLDVSQIEKHITQKTKAIVPVGLYGQVADMKEINAIAEHYSQKMGHKIYVIEDACQSFGATYQGKMSCQLSDIGCTSFFPAKPLGCYGDGGAVFTDDDHLAKKINMLRVHGQSARYYHKYIGMNARFDTLQAAVLNVKMPTFAHEVKTRLALAKRYDAILPQDKIVIPFVKNDRTSIYAQYSIRVKNRDNFVKKMGEFKIPTAVHYPMALHLQECFLKNGYKKGDYPVAEKIAEEIVSLPMSPFLTEAQQDYIAAHICNSV